MILMEESFMILFVWYKFIVMFKEIVRKFLYILICNGIIIYKES